MPTLKAVHRPHNMEEALTLLNREDVTTAVLAGGTSLVPAAADTVDELVDLQALALGGISHAGVQMQIGAATTLQELVDDEAAPDILRELARYEGPNTFRNAGTIGGVVAAGDGESELLAGLLVCNTAVTIQYSTHRDVFPLPDLLPNRAAKLQGRHHHRRFAAKADRRRPRTCRPYPAGQADRRRRCRQSKRRGTAAGAVRRGGSARADHAR
jgi:CO/xanthine dehydrogenase FAD-binding subunit